MLTPVFNWSILKERQKAESTSGPFELRTLIWTKCSLVTCPEYKSYAGLLPYGVHILELCDQIVLIYGYKYLGSLIIKPYNKDKLRN